MQAGFSGKARDFLRGLIVAAVAGLFLTLSGAFGTGAAPFWPRLAYWVGLMLAGSLWGHACGAWTARRIDVDTRPWAAIAIKPSSSAVR